VTKVDQKGGLFKRLRRGLAKTRDLLTTDLDELFTRKKQIDDELLEDLEEILITADIGVQTAMDLIGRVSGKTASIDDAATLKKVLKEEILSLLQQRQVGSTEITAKPHVVMVIGVNGVGKTTTVGKLAAKFSAADKKVLIAAADTFRAAAIEQLAIWAHRAGADFVRHRDGADPAAVAFDGIEAAVARGADVVLVDTAGRLHTKVNLMEELKKIKRSVSKKLPDAPHEILLVLDATTGQNALSQAKMFNEALNITGIALTKLDGTAKGGIVVSIYNSLNIPLRYIGMGENIEDLQDFAPRQFVDALF
jgi:fused signal recognition particle receptor